MKIFKIISLVLISIVNCYCLYCTVGYLLLGINTPKLLGNSTTYFTGSYIMSIMYFVFTIILTIITIFIIKSLKRKNT